MRTLVPIATALLLIAAAPDAVSEPDGLWQGPMHSATPNSVKGASVIDTDAFAELRDRVHPLIVDVDMAQKPPATSPDRPWMPMHRSIPGAVWLQGAGSGSTDPAFATAFKMRISSLTGGDMERPIVVFCHPQCWGSWNAAKRLVGLGYHRVYWYPEGFEGWQNKYASQPVEEDPAWETAIQAEK